MKNYFDFRLRGNEIFSYYLCIFISIIIFMYTSIQYTTATSNITAGVVPANTPIVKELGMYLAGLFIYVITILIFSFHIIRDSIKATNYNGEELRFEGTLGEYLKVSLLGYFLTLITFGIYTPWFYKNITNFYSKSTSYKNIKFRFNGKLIPILLIIYIPAILYLVLLFISASSLVADPMMVYPFLAVTYLIISAVIFLMYRWLLDMSHDNMSIKMVKTNPVLGSLYVFKEIIFTVLTIGLYLPAAIIHLSRFYINRLEVKDENDAVVATFGVEFSIRDDFFYVFAQCLLICVTLGIYFPWAYTNITRRLMNKTYKINNY